MDNILDREKRLIMIFGLIIGVIAIVTVGIPMYDMLHGVSKSITLALHLPKP